MRQDGRSHERPSHRFSTLQEQTLETHNMKASKEGTEHSKEIKKSTALLSLIPLAFLILIISFSIRLQPFYAGPHILDYDPAYTYLLGGLQLINGQILGFTDHPGLASQLLATAGIYAKAVAAYFPNIHISTQEINNIVFSQPEAVLTTIGILGATLTSYALRDIGLSLYECTNAGLYLSLTTQLLAFSILTSLLNTFSLNAETTVIPCSLLLISTAIRNVYSKADQGGKLSTGFWSGLLITTIILGKPNFWPLAILGACCARKFSILTIQCCTITATIALLKIKEVYNWRETNRFWERIATHSGYYGGGESGFIDMNMLDPTSLRSYGYLPTLFIGLAAFAATIFFATRKARNRQKRRCFIKETSRAAIFACAYAASAAIALGLTEKHQLKTLAASAVIFIIFECLRWKQKQALCKSRAHNRFPETRLTASLLGAQLLISLALIKHFEVRYSLPLAICALAVTPLVSERRQNSFTERAIPWVHTLIASTGLAVSTIWISSITTDRDASLESTYKKIDSMNQRFPDHAIYASYRFKGLQETALGFGLRMSGNRWQSRDLLIGIPKSSNIGIWWGGKIFRFQSNEIIEGEELTRYLAYEKTILIQPLWDPLPPGANEALEEHVSKDYKAFIFN